MEPGHAHVLFPGPLLRFHEPGRPIDADNEVSGDFGVEGTGVTRFLDPEDPFDPGHDLVGKRVRGLIEVEDTVPDVLGERALEGGETRGERGVVSCAYVEAVVVLEEDRPLGGVEGGREALRFDRVVPVRCIRFIGS